MVVLVSVAVAVVGVHFEGRRVIPLPLILVRIKSTCRQYVQPNSINSGVVTAKLKVKYTTYSGAMLFYILQERTLS